MPDVRLSQQRRESAPCRTAERGHFRTHAPQQSRYSIKILGCREDRSRLEHGSGSVPRQPQSTLPCCWYCLKRRPNAVLARQIIFLPRHRACLEIDGWSRLIDANLRCINRGEWDEVIAIGDCGGCSRRSGSASPGRCGRPSRRSTGPFLSLRSAGLNGGSVATLSGGTVYSTDEPFADIPKGGWPGYWLFCLP